MSFVLWRNFVSFSSLSFTFSLILVLFSTSLFSFFLSSFFVAVLFLFFVSFYSLIALSSASDFSWDNLSAFPFNLSCFFWFHFLLKFPKKTALLPPPAPERSSHLATAASYLDVACSADPLPKYSLEYLADLVASWTFLFHSR